MKETIKHAAVIAENEWVFMGKCHADCFGKMLSVGLKWKKAAGTQGFVTSNGRYVDRSCALQIALEAGQVVDIKGGLFSEDLWCNEYCGTHRYSEIEGYFEEKENGNI